MARARGRSRVAETATVTAAPEVTVVLANSATTDVTRVFLPQICSAADCPTTQQSATAAAPPQPRPTKRDRPKGSKSSVRLGLPSDWIPPLPRERARTAQYDPAIEQGSYYHNVGHWRKQKLEAEGARIAFPARRCNAANPVSPPSDFTCSNSKPGALDAIHCSVHCFDATAVLCSRDGKRAGELRRKRHIPRKITKHS